MTTFPFWASLDGMPRMRTQIATLLYRPFSFFKRQDEIFAEIFIWPIGKKIAYNFILIESIQFIFIERYNFGYGISSMVGLNYTKSLVNADSFCAKFH